MSQPDLDGPVKSTQVVITRFFNAPRELVFKTWTRADLLERWWSPRIFTTPVVRMDFRVGGSFVFCMRSPEGQEFWAKGEYLEIVEPERIVYRDFFVDADENVIPPSAYGMASDDPTPSLVTVTFKEENGGTRMTLRTDSTVFTEQETRMANQGWNEMFDKLDVLLAEQP